MELSSERISQLRGQAQELSAIVQIGKAGLSDSVIEELEAALRRERLVKVRFLRSARAGEDQQALAKELAERTSSVLVEIRGHTVVLYRPRAGQEA